MRALTFSCQKPVKVLDINADLSGNIVGKLLHKAMPPRGLTLRFEKDQSAVLDIRMVLAGLTLLQVHDITGVNR